MPRARSKKSGNRRRTSSRGILFVVSAPSGAGKTTLVVNLLRRDRRLVRTVSHTTRAPRAVEKNGQDYSFVSCARFEKMIRQKAFLEWAKAYGDRYGTSRQAVEKPLRAGKDLVLVIESHGGRAIRRLFPDAVLILVLPPDLATLRKRLRGREKDRSSLARRIRVAQSEVRSLRGYDYLVINDRVAEGVRQLEAIVSAERRKISRNEEVIGRFLRKTTV
ncbi:MAG: guanylate kinase [Pseudomonadota bacterium]